LRTKELLIVLFLFVQNLLIAQQGQYNIVNCKYSSVGYLVRGINVDDAEETEIYPKQNIQVNITSVGQYSITTNTVNGIYFSANGTFRSTGLQTVELRSSGAPINYGEFTYAIGDCDFKRYTYIPDRRYKDITTQGQDSLGVGGITARHHRLIYKAFESVVTGEEWMTSNLGANYNKVGHPNFNPDAIPTAVNDINAFGSIYQWGRYSDGHELINWISNSDLSNTSVNGTTTVKSTGDDPGHNKMVLQPQWQTTPNDRLWQGESGLNNPCSVGFRIPVQAEFSKESDANNINNINDAFHSQFQIVAPGARKYLDGLFENIPGYQSVYWTSSKPSGTTVGNSHDYHFQATTYEHSTSRGFGFSVRCILLSYLFKACDYDYDGEEVFDLNTIAAQIKQDYPNYKVTFYTSFFNAQVGAALGSLTGNFTATTAQNPNIIFARLEDASGKFIDGVKIKLMVYEAPKADNFKTIFYCTTIIGNTNGVFNLRSIENSVENSANYTFKYYTKEASATLGGTTDIIANPSSYNGSVGSVYVRIENANGCFIVRAIPLAVSSMTLPAQTINVATFCATTNLDLISYTSQLSNNDPGRYQFYFYTDQASSNSNTIANAIPDPENFDASRLTDFSIWVNITLNGGINCTKIVSKLNFSLIAMPDINTKPILPICAGNIITLEAETSVGNIVKWYDSETSIIPIFTGNSFITPVLQTDTTYWVESTNSLGCASYRISFEVKVNALPVFSIPSDVLICENSATILEVTTARSNTVNWYASPTSVTPFFTGHQYQTSVIPSDTSFWIEVINPESCVSERTEILVETKSKVKPEFTLQDQWCKDSQPIQLPLVSNNGISGTWDVPNIDASTIGTKTYTFTPTDSCTLIFTIEITIVPLPEINNVNIDRTDIIVEATGDSLEYSLDGTNWQTSNVITNAIVGNYKIYVRNISGCIVEYSGVLALSVNNFISPNGDGNNDYWEIKGLPNNTNVQILDRNGKIFINKKVENNFKWDGKENGKPLQSGTYWYALTLENGQKVSGFIFLKNH
jgi:gliding motility-associated-like protein